MCGYIKRGAFADLRLGRSSENHINFEVLKPMGRLRNQMKWTVGFVTGNRSMVIDRELTVQVLGENRMDRAAMNMTRIPMTMISLGMHVEEWNHEHPYGRPHEDQYPRTRWLVTYPLH
jgi:hypothetical protein